MDSGIKRVTVYVINEGNTTIEIHSDYFEAKLRANKMKAKGKSVRVETADMIVPISIRIEAATELQGIGS